MEGAAAQQQVQANPFQPLPQEQQQQAPEGFGSAGARRRAVGTLDETVWATLMRDARRVAVNTKCVCNSLRCCGVSQATRRCVARTLCGLGFPAADLHARASASPCRCAWIVAACHIASWTHHSMPRLTDSFMD